MTTGAPKNEVTAFNGRTEELHGILVISSQSIPAEAPVNKSTVRNFRW